MQNSQNQISDYPPRQFLLGLFLVKSMLNLKGRLDFFQYSIIITCIHSFLHYYHKLDFRLGLLTWTWDFVLGLGLGL